MDFDPDTESRAKLLLLTVGFIFIFPHFEISN